MSIQNNRAHNHDVTAKIATFYDNRKTKMKLLSRNIKSRFSIRHHCKNNRMVYTCCEHRKLQNCAPQTKILSAIRGQLKRHMQIKCQIQSRDEQSNDNESKSCSEGKREKMLLKREHGRTMPFNQTEPVFHTATSCHTLSTASIHTDALAHYSNN